MANAKLVSRGRFCSQHFIIILQLLSARSSSFPLPTLLPHFAGWGKANVILFIRQGLPILHWGASLLEDPPGVRSGYGMDTHTLTSDFIPAPKEATVVPLRLGNSGKRKIVLLDIYQLCCAEEMVAVCESKARASLAHCF